MKTPVPTTRITRRINAPRALVYRALLDPRAIVQWKVPEGMSAEVHEFDPREGGRVGLTTSASAALAAPGPEPQLS